MWKNVRQKSVDRGLRQEKNMVGWVIFFFSGPHTPVTFLEKYLPRENTPWVLTNLKSSRPTRDDWVSWLEIPGLVSFSHRVLSLECLSPPGLMHSLAGTLLKAINTSRLNVPCWCWPWWKRDSRKKIPVVNFSRGDSKGKYFGQKSLFFSLPWTRIC